MTPTDNPFADHRQRLFHGLEAATICPCVDDDESLYARDSFPLTDDELAKLVKTGVLVAAGGCFGLTDSGRAMMVKRMAEVGMVRGPEAAKCPVAELEIPIDF